MLTVPNLGHYRNSEFIRYQKNVVEICLNNSDASFDITTQVDELVDCITPLNELFRRARTNPVTGDIVELDARRDKALTGIRTVAEGFALYYEAEMVEAARSILRTIDKYGRNISRFNYKAESQVIESLVSEFNNDAALAAAINRMGLTKWVAEMAHCNQAFDDKYIDRTIDYADKPSSNLTQLRTVTTEKYNQLRNHIFSHHTLKPTTTSNQLVNELNSLTEQYNKAITSRSDNRTDEE